MIANFNTKPMQGTKFIKFRNQILGICETDYDEYKKEYIAVLKQYDLLKDKDDLGELFVDQ